MKKPKPAPGVELRRRAEAKLKAHERAPKAKGRSPTSETDPRRLLHELQIHQTELEMQNKELVQARDEREAALQRYTELYDFAPAGYLTLRADGTIRQANLTVATLLGMERSRLLHRRFSLFVAAEARAAFEALLRRVCETKLGEVGELRLSIKGKPPLTVQLEACVSGEGQECRVVLLDLSRCYQVEDGLRKLSRFNQGVLDALTTHICVLDNAGRILAVNRAWRDFAAANPPLSTKVDVGADYFAVCEAATGEDAPRAREALQGLHAVARGEAPEFCLEYHCHAPHTERWFEMRVTRLADDGSGSLVVAHTNITRRKQAELALRESEQRYRAVVEDQTEVISRFKADGTLTFVNEVFCRFFGKPSEELVGRKWEIQAASEDRATIKQKLRTLSPENPIVVIENRVYSGTGEVRWMQFVNRAFFDSKGRLLETQAVGRDITERKQLEAKLVESEAAARARADEVAVILAATPAITFVAHDRDCRHMTSSDAALRLLRLPDGANTSKSAPPTERPETFRAMKDGRELRLEELPVQLAAATGQPVKDFELTLTFDDGTARDLVGDAVPLFDAEGKVRGAVGAFLDITEHKQTEAAIHQLSARLLQVQDEERRRLARDLHDTTGQSLAALSIELSLLQHAAPTLKGQAKHLLVHSLALAEQCAREIRTSSYLLHPPILDDLGLAGAMRDHADGLARRNGLRVDLELPADLARFPRETELALFRVLQEALSNIHRHSGSKTASITLKQTPEEIRLEVRDQGRGMGGGAAPAGKGARADTLGTGILGMSERMRQLGGRLEIESDDHGTRVVAILPRHQEAARA